MTSKLKKLRIPGVVKILDSLETDSSLIIATERVSPLSTSVDHLSEEARVWGLHAVGTTLHQLFSQAKCAHGNVNISTIMVNQAGEWQLGGLEIATSISDQQENTLYTYGSLVPGSSRYIPPEVEKNGWQILQRQPELIDSWQFGRLIHEVFASSRAKPAILNIQKQLCHVNPKQRMAISRLFNSNNFEKAFGSQMTEISENIMSLAILSSFEFDTFIEKLSNSKDNFPVQYVHYKILPQLIKSFEYSQQQHHQQQQQQQQQQQLQQQQQRPIELKSNDITTKCLSLIFQIAQNLSKEEYSNLVTPLIIKLYKSPDRVIRLQLLGHVSSYIAYLDKRIVSEKIFPSLATGFSDSEPVIRENSLKSILNIINKLNDSIVNGELLRILAKTQNDAMPEIRANTTILLGRIATSFSKSTKSTVLIAAFSRALKDSFVQSRIAALLALSATAEQFTPLEICSKLVGALAPSLIDSDKSVRQQAQITMDMFMTKVRVHAKTLDDKAGNESSQSKGMSSLFDNDVSLFDSPNSSAKTATERVKSPPPEKNHTTTLLPTTTVPLPTFTDKAFDVDLDDTNEWDEGWDDNNNNNIDEVNDAWAFDDEKNDKLLKKTKSLSLEPKEDGEDDAWSNWD